MYTAKPEWLRIKFRDNQKKKEVEEILKRLSLNTVCQEANCPNIIECFSKKTATFMILGNICTRNCTFCNVKKGTALDVDIKEPENVAKAVNELNLRHVVITSVTRDDLDDGGAGHFVNVIKKIRALDNNIIIEVLIPDFKGDLKSIFKVIQAKPDIINHNVETIPRLYSSVRPMANYTRSMEIIKNIKLQDNTIYTKSGIMVGLGEKEDEVIKVLKDLRNVNCDLLTIGQYLSPSKHHHPIVEYIHPDVFEKYKKIGLDLGFKYVASAPFVRSSYNAENNFFESNKRN